MHNFRSAQDEFVEIERRWSLLCLREKELRAKEQEIRQFMSYKPMLPHQHVPQQVPQHAPQGVPQQVPQWDNTRETRRNNTKSRCFSNKHREDKDYSKLAARRYIDADGANNDADKSP